MRGLFCGATILIVASAPVQSQQPDVLEQLVGLWTAEWVAGGSSKVEQVQFNINALNRQTAALPCTDRCDPTLFSDELVPGRVEASTTSSHFALAVLTIILPGELDIVIVQ